MTSTPSTAATTLPKPDKSLPGAAKFPERQGALFNRRHADWLAAKAELAALHVREEEDVNEAIINATSDRLDDLTRELMTTYSEFAWMTGIKFQIFEEIINDDASWTDKKQIWMLGCLKADFLALSDRAILAGGGR